MKSTYSQKQGLCDAQTSTYSRQSLALETPKHNSSLQSSHQPWRGKIWKNTKYENQKENPKGNLEDQQKKSHTKGAGKTRRISISRLMSTERHQHSPHFPGNPGRMWPPFDTLLPSPFCSQLRPRWHYNKRHVSKLNLVPSLQPKTFNFLNVIYICIYNINI